MNEDLLFNRIFKENYNKVLFYVNSYVNNMGRAEDIAQEAFYKFWQTREGLDYDTNITSYLFVIARNLALNSLRHDKIIKKHEEYSLQKQMMDFNLAALENDSSISIYSKEVSRLLQQGIEHIPPYARETFLLSRKENLTHKEIADKLNVSTKTVEGRITTALKVLRTVLKDYLPVLIGCLPFWV